MKRREFITLLGGAAACPLGARAQQPDRMRRVGVLFTLAKENAEGRARMIAFRQRLEALGWIDNRNLRIDERWATPDSAPVATYAAELANLRPDAILVGGSRAFVAVQQETHAIPIVFVAAAGTTEHGIVTSVARPTGNVTGFTTVDDFSLAGKMLGILKETAPRLIRIAFIMHREHPSLAGYRSSLAIDASSLGVELTVVAAGSAAEIESAIAAFAREPNGGMLLPPDQFNIVHRELIIELAARHLLPTIYAYRSHVAAGGLMSYGTDFPDLYRRAAGYIDRILKGEKPANLPVQLPTTYELAINLKTGRALGLEIPAAVLARADEVIE
jgi:putative ABC transport system substrate-binding protein